MRRLARWLAVLLAVPALLVLAAAGAAWWLVGTQSGLEWALGQAASLSSGRLEVRGAQGSFIRSFSAEAVTLRNEGNVLRAEDVSARLDLLSLSTGTLHVDELAARQVDVSLEAKPESEEPPPSELGVPLPVEVEAARIDRLTVQRAGETYAATDLRFSYAGDATEHRLTDVSAQTPWGRVSLEGSMAATPPFRIEARASLERKEGRANAYVRAQPFAAEKLEALQLDAERIDLSRFDPSLPSTSLTASLQGEATRDALFAGVLRAANGRPGPIDAGRIPAVALDAKIAVRGRTVHIQRLDAAAAGGTITGSGVASLDGAQPSATLKLDLRGIDLRAARSNLRRTALAGKVEVEATPARQSVKGRVAQADMTLSADAVRTGERVEVRSFEAAAAGGTASGSGTLQLGEPLRFEAKLRFSGFDPARFGDYPEGMLNGRAEVAGSLGEPLRARARWTLADSRLAGKPLATEGRGVLEGRRATGLEAQARWGDNRLSVSGALGTPGDSLSFRLQAPDLPQDFLAGRIDASGTASGSWKDPRVAFRADVAPATVAGRVKLDALSVRGEGTLGEHTLRIAAGGEGFDAQATLEGGWREGVGWRGALAGLTNAGRYPLQLQAPVPLLITPGSVTAGELRARLGAGWLFVRNLEWEPGRLVTRGEFAGLPARWPIVAAGLADTLRSTLLLDGSWDLASTPQLQGRVTVRRASGDLRVLQPAPLALGLRDAALVARFDDGALDATLEIDAALGEASAKASTSGLEPDSALRFEARVALEDIRALAGPLPPELRVAGSAVATLRGQGTLADPALAGTLRADGLSVHVPPYGIYLGDGTLRASLQGDALQVEELVLRAGEGTLTASGRLPLAKGAADPALRWQASQLRVLSRPDMRLVVSGGGTAGLEDRRFSLQGRLEVENGYIERGFERLPKLGDDVVIVDAPASKGDSVEVKEVRTRKPGAGPPVDLDLTVDLGRDFKVRQAGFDGLLRGEVRLVTAEGELRAFGRIEAADATFRAYGRTLQVDPGAIIFDGPLGNPSLQIDAWRRNQEVPAGVRVTGTLEQPRVELVSDPPLPEGAKLSWLVLGRPPAEASGGDLALLQTAASALLGRGDKVPITTRIADAVGLDELSLRGSSELSERVVAVGKRISDRIYLTYEQGVGAVAQNLVKVDLALTERISLRGQTGTTSGAGVFYRYAWD